MALVDPNIALAVKPIEIQDPMAQYGKIIAIQNAQNQNRLAGLQMQEYERTRAEEEGTRNFLRGRKLSDPETVAGLAAFGKTGLTYAKQIQEQEAAALNAKNTQSQINQRDWETQDKKLKFAWNAVGSATTPQAAIAELTKGVKDGVFDMKSASNEIQQLQNMTPEQYQQYRVQKVMGILDAKDKLGFMLPKVARQDIGGQVITIQDNPALPGYGQPIAGGSIAKTATIGERTAQGQLNLAQQRFMWEKANPGFELKEDADGNFYGINKRTLQATPVMVGGTAPMATPAAPSAGMLGPRVPAPVTQAIPGMPSVLDRPVAAPAVATPSASSTAGTQLRGKKDIPAKFADTDMQLSGLAGSLKEFKNEVGKQLATGAKFLPTGADTARMQAKYTALLMGVKDLYTLGALAGPDMSIIESQLTNPASWSGKLTSQKGFEEQVKVIEDMLKRSANNLENTYGRQPKATKEALKSLESGLTGASATNPLGLPGL